jgi:4-hydroxy-tetrahydrodipicolinate synthase
MANTERFSGVISPALTPFKADLSPDTERFVKHCNWLLEQGCAGLAVFGTTSEANSQSGAERMALLEALVESGIDPKVLMPGTGATSITEAVQLTKHAVDLGCGGVLMLPPYYYKNVNDDGIFRFFDEVIQRIGDDKLQVYLYHIPPQTVFGFSLDLIGRLVHAYPKTVVGLKDSSGDWNNMEAILKNFPGFNMFPGSEIHMLAGLRNGASGCITATANANPAQLRSLYDNWQTPQADDMQAAITALRKTIQSFPMVPALKEIIAHFKEDDGWKHNRPPFTQMPAEQVKDLLAELAKHNFSLEPSKLAMAGDD